MNFYDKYSALCNENKIKPTSNKMAQITGVTTAAISMWNTKGSLPSTDVICKLAQFFNVTSDYLLGLSELRNPTPVLSPQQKILLESFEMADIDGQNEIIYVCRLEMKKAEARRILEEGHA